MAQCELPGQGEARFDLRPADNFGVQKEFLMCSLVSVGPLEANRSAAVARDSIAANVGKSGRKERLRFSLTGSSES